MTEKHIADAIGSLINAQAPAMFAMLETLVNKESGSYDVADVDALGEYLAEQFAGLGCEIKRYPAKNAGFPLLATVLPRGAASDAGRILLLGHRDTVFPAGTTATRPFTSDDTRCYGPGVADMKGGIVSGFFAMKTLLALKDEVGPMPMEMMLASDEEIGSGSSAPAIIDRCKTARACFGLEPARAGGEVVIGRDGAGLFTLEVHGKSSHAGISFSEGISAINALASIIVALSTLSDDAGGMTVNTGVVEGGSGGFVVPGYARATVSLRFATLELRDQLLKRIQAIIADHNKNGITATMTEPLCYLPMRESEDNSALFAMVQAAGAAYGLSIPGIVTKGSSDSGLPASHGVPTICGVGCVGGNLHTNAEYMVSASLAERTKALALAMVIARDRFVK